MFQKFYLRSLLAAAVLLLSVSIAHAQQADYSKYKPLVEKNATAFGISATDAKDAVITNAYTDESTKITYLYLQQAYQQVKVYNTIISAAFRNGALLYSSGTFVKDIAHKAVTATPARGYADAVRAALRHLSLNDQAPLKMTQDLFAAEKKYKIAAPLVAERDIEVQLYWETNGLKNQAILTWNVNIDLLSTPDWWNVRISAETNDFVSKDNWTVSEHNSSLGNVPGIDNTTQLPTNWMVYTPPMNCNTQVPVITNNTFNAPPPTVLSADYRVYPFPVESPSHGAAATVSNPWLLAGAGNNATTNGWHFDGTTNYDITRGNNVFAFLDRRANNNPDAQRNWPDTSLTPNPSLSFAHDIVPTEQPFQNTENKKVALDNLFYWNNIIHDVMYQYGLTEPAGAFQADNLGRGGAGNDPVMANALDSAGFDNANFGTPADGGSGRMQMYTWSGTPKVTINAPEAIAGVATPAQESSWQLLSNRLIYRGPLTNDVVWYNDNAGGTVHSGCAAATNAAALNGKIALIDGFGGTGCTTYAFKVKNCQNAGAVAVIIYSANAAAISLFINDQTNAISIPVVSVSGPTGNAIIAQLNQNNPVNVTLASGIYLDGDLDNGIITHEYGHGISNRLTAGPANAGCLGNAEQGGEGWSDYFALMLTTNWNAANVSDGTIPRPVGTYAFNQPTSGFGIRRYPYSTNMAVNPLTYANMATNTEVHATGEIWTAALWDMTWNIIQQENAITGNLYNSAGNGGNVKALNLVMMGLKLQPCSPGFLDARDAILAADSIMYNFAHKCAIWNAFARRGMGVSARQGLSTSATDQTAATDQPTSVKVTDQQGLFSVVKSTQTTITHTAVCDCQAVSGYQLRDTIPAGFTYVSSSPAGTLNGNVLTFPAASFNAEEVKNFTITLQAPASGCDPDFVINDNRGSSTTGGLVGSGTPGWSTSTVKSYSPTASWFAPNLTTTGASFLTSPSVGASAGQNLSILSFYHYFNTEKGYDGGVVEYSTDGTTWLDASPYFYQNGYNSRFFADGSLPNRASFTGNNYGFAPTALDISSFGTTPVAFRFRLESDNFLGFEGWYIDDIIRASGCGAILKTGMYNGANVAQDNSYTPIFVTDAVLPLNLLSFSAAQLGKQVTLDWKTASEINLRNFSVEWSKDGTNFSSIGTVPARNSSATENSYNLLHNNPVAGNNYYRLKMNDIDGHFTYSPVRIVKILDKSPMLVLLPNPVKTDATLYISKTLEARAVKIYNAAGALVQDLRVGPGVQKLAINTSNLAAGIYTVEAVGNDKVVTRMVVQH